MKLVGKDWVTPFKKLDYLPEAHTDFIMAIIGEEFGFIGIFVVVILLGLLIFRAMKIGRESLYVRTAFPWFLLWVLVSGFSSRFRQSRHGLGMLPTKGLTFPLVSYGGSSIIIMSATVGILLRIDHENRLQRGGHTFER